MQLDPRKDLQVQKANKMGWYDDNKSCQILKLSEAPSVMLYKLLKSLLYIINTIDNIFETYCLYFFTACV